MHITYHTYMQSTYCVHAVSFLLRLANSPQSDHQWFSERQTGMPPEARAKGVAAKALAKAAFAVKAKAQSAGLAKGRGAGPQGTLRPSEPAPVATRRYGRKAVPACLQRQGPRDRLPRRRPRQWRPAWLALPSEAVRSGRGAPGEYGGGSVCPLEVVSGWPLSRGMGPR